MKRRTAIKAHRCHWCNQSTLEYIMKVLRFCFCKDADGHVGLARSFDHGYLTVLFDDGERRVAPNEVTFL